MNLIDLTKQLLNRLTSNALPYKHRNACLGMVFTLIILLLVPDSESIVTEQQSTDPILEINNLAFSTSTFDPLNNIQEPPLENVLSVETEQEIIQSTRSIVEVRSGDNLSLIFDRAGLTPQDVYRVSNSGGDASILTRLYPGYSLAFDVNEERKLNELEVIISPLESYLFKLNILFKLVLFCSE